MDALTAPDAVSFDCFGTLLTVERPEDPAAAVATALDDHGITVPDDWANAYVESHVDVQPGRECSLVDHVAAALESRAGTSFAIGGVRAAVQDAFETAVETRAGARRAVEAAAAAGPIGVCSNCAVPGLVERSLSRSAIDHDRFDAIVTSVGCGWRKPNERAFEAIADELGVEPTRMLHVGDDPETDGAAPNAILLSDRSLSALATRWRTD